MPFIRNRKNRLAAAKFIGVNYFMTQTMMLGRQSGIFHEHSIRRTDEQSADLVKDFFTSDFFQLVPQRVGAKQKRNIPRLFVISGPDHPRKSMRAAALMRNLELFDTQNARSGGGEMKTGG